MKTSKETTGALETIRALTGKVPLMKFNKGEFIFEAGQPGDCLYGIVDGWIQLHWNDGPNHETIGPGSTFGIGALVTPEHRRFGTAIALTDSQLLVLNREKFLFAIQELPMFALEMLHDIEERLQGIRSMAYPLANTTDRPE